MKNKIDIVIIEDNPNDAELMVRSMKKNRLANSIIVLEDGELALDYFFSRGKYAGKKIVCADKVIFLDLKLPKISGLEILKKLKNNDKTKNIPVVVVSSSKQDPDIKTAYELGANSYVVKPIEYIDFVEMMNQLNLYWLVVNENSK